MTRLRGRLTTVALVVLASGGCSGLPWIDDAAPSAPATPVTAPSVLLVERVGTSVWQLESYDTDRGPCVDLVGPDGSRQPRCVHDSPLEHPDAPQWMVVDGMDAAMSVEDAPVTWLVSGLARPEVSAIELRPEEGRGGTVPLAGWDDVHGGHSAFLAAVPEGVRRFELRAYDHDGCLLQLVRHDLEPTEGQAIDQEVLSEPDCSRRLPGTGEDPNTQAAGRCDPDLANAPPVADELHLYVPCLGETDPRVVYRRDLGRTPSGDVVADAERVLAALLAGPTDPVDGDSWFGSRGMRVAGLWFRGDDMLVVDLVFPPEGVGLLNASHASVVWHRALTGTLLQFPEVGRIELRERGSCERYSRSFESSGCIRYDRGDAPWAAG